jgi:hypothetical protein
MIRIGWHSLRHVVTHQYPYRKLMKDDILTRREKEELDFLRMYH